MNVLTCVATCSFDVKEVNDEIEKRQEAGWYLRGTPLPIYQGPDDYLLLTFEKPESDEVLEAEETNQPRGGSNSIEDRESEVDYLSY